ncbi:hypothetical protein MmiAt1_04270 [Methanimicrococcus sp. At1]|uniref:Uncharacterized protein n=1 Tax=Methanimicrococcus hacksteinii TaxID=3028293 RepID=A0ABU3VND3_9EURY|nr:hypothetical protein [Methanimicrococcus sp. At1]MDV0444881.1 hypothetical protein [Methanimicrococcus sp. At1]
MIQKPTVSAASAFYQKTEEDELFSYYTARCIFENEGPGIGRNMTITVYPIIYASETLLQNQTVYAGNVSEDGRKSVDFEFKVPHGSGSVYYIIGGENFESFMIPGFYLR